MLETQHSVVSQAHTWPFQHLSRPDIQNGQINLYGVVPESGNCKQGFPDHGISFNRPVCYSSEPQAATICVTHTIQEGATERCSFDGLEWHSYICVSSVPSHTSCDQQSTVISVQNYIKHLYGLTDRGSQNYCICWWHHRYPCQ